MRMKTLGENIKNKQQLHEYTLHMRLIKTLKKEEKNKKRREGVWKLSEKAQ